MEPTVWEVTFWREDDELCETPSACFCVETPEQAEREAALLRQRGYHTNCAPIAAPEHA